jgi:hypothetical protein
LEVSCTWMDKTFSRFEKFSVFILLNILHNPLACISSPFWFSDLVFWWSNWALAYSFHSSGVVWLRVLLFFSWISILSSSSYILSSTCSILLEWPSTVFD